MGILGDVKKIEDAILNTYVGENKIRNVVFGIDFVPLYVIMQTSTGQLWKASIREGVNGYSFSLTEFVCSRPPD